MAKAHRPSDKLTPRQRFQRDQRDMFRIEFYVDFIEQISTLSPEQRQRLVVAAPAFVAGEGGHQMITTITATPASGMTMRAGHHAECACFVCQPWTPTYSTPLGSPVVFPVPDRHQPRHVTRGESNQFPVIRSETNE